MWNPYNGDGSYSYTVTYQPRRRFEFSRKEKQDLSKSILIIALAFAIAFTVNSGAFNIYTFAFNFGIGFAAALLGFLLHEMAHKYVAIKYGCWSEFRASDRGLMFALFISLMGWLILAPGAVMISGRITKAQNGKISAAGPLTNMLIGYPLMALSLYVIFPINELIGIMLFWIGTLNIFLAWFNLLPIPPLDGSKIWKWNIPVYLCMIIPSSIAVFTFWF